MININFDKVEDGQDYSPVKPGWHDARIEKIEEKTTRKGDSMWAVTWRLLDSGKVTWDNFIFAGKALQRFKKFSVAVDMPTRGNVQLDENRYMGKECQIELIVEKYEDRKGETRTKNGITFLGFRRMGQENQEPQQPANFGEPPF